MSDLLEQAIRASREAPASEAQAAATRRRILESAQRAAPIRRPRRLAPWILPLVAAFIATGALAAGPLGLTKLFSASPPAPPQTAPMASTGAAVPAARAKPVDPSTVAEAPSLAPEGASSALQGSPPSASGDPAALTGAVLPGPSPAARVGSPAASHLPSAPASSPAASPAAPLPADPADELYRTAHDLHFRGGDASATVSAWDRYLVAAPRGRFAVEARYNRALALLRAGRRAEGIGALTPFADGAYGSYRRDEAARLVAALKDAGAQLFPSPRPPLPLPPLPVYSLRVLMARPCCKRWPTCSAAS